MVTRKTLKSIIDTVQHLDPKPKVLPGRSAEEFLNTYDLPTKIQRGLDKLGASWMFESDLVRLCGLNQQQFTAHRAGFAEYIVREPENDRDKRVWAGTKAFANKLKAPR